MATAATRSSPVNLQTINQACSPSPSSLAQTGGRLCRRRLRSKQPGMGGGRERQQRRPQPGAHTIAAIGAVLTLTTTLLLRCTARLLLPATKARRAPLLSRGAARQAACWRAAAAVCLLLAQAGCAAARASDILRLVCWHHSRPPLAR